MSGAAAVLADVLAELERASQQVGETMVLPDRIRVRLPVRRYRRWAPVLDSVAGEIGVALLDWARSREALWYRGDGPELDLGLVRVSRTRVRCDYSAEHDRSVERLRL